MSKGDYDALDVPRIKKRRLPSIGMSPESFGKASESFARFMGTPQFLIGMTVFCFVWLAWNTLMPEPLQFDPRALNFTLLTLILSLQASYAAPLILLAENRSADRDRVEFENDRQRAERNLADTEYLTREVASLRIAMREMATRDFIRSELRNLLEEMEEAREADRRAEHREDLETVKKVAVKKAVKKAQATAEATALKAARDAVQTPPENREDA
ncbi:DUF1003 domain-containing protein [Nocardia zapadnayensis]|uniref:DUF1003 domain-containing protein n=2 Tax=Brevibacterium TaxID=1696 RepID=A0ABP8JIJ0_9MICO|nr:DUF1003 domain-containing protein [Nocardia zapadnayensis]MCX0276260.1 DUF1003 domain-containing protein [Nocardia zapadnayensis]